MHKPTMAPWLERAEVVRNLTFRKSCDRFLCSMVESRQTKEKEKEVFSLTWCMLGSYTPPDPSWYPDVCEMTCLRAFACTGSR